MSNTTASSASASASANMNMYNSSASDATTFHHANSTSCCNNLDVSGTRKPIWNITKTILTSVASMIAVVAVLSYLFPLMISVQGVNIQQMRDHVQRDTCECSCWDGLFKGGYGREHYKSVYWNMDEGTPYLLFLVLFYGIAAQKAIVRVIETMFKRPTSALGVAFVFHVVWYPNFYCFWMYFNYINDRWWSMWQPQMYYSVTEQIMAVCLYWIMSTELSFDVPQSSATYSNAELLANKHEYMRVSQSDDALKSVSIHSVDQETIPLSSYFKGASPQGKFTTSQTRMENLMAHWYMTWVVSFLSCSHIIRGSLDQFIKNVLLGRGSVGQSSRDIAFMTGDLTLFAWSLCYLYKVSQESVKVAPDTPTKTFSMRKCATVFIVALVFEQYLLNLVPHMGV